MKLREFNRFIKLEKHVALINLTKVIGSSPRELGAWMLVSQNKSFNTIGGGVLEFSMMSEAKKMLDRKCKKTKIFKSNLNPKIDQCCGGVVECEISILNKKKLNYIEQKIKDEISYYDNLFLFGAGHVGKAIIKLGINLPFKITVTDDRADLLRDLKKKYIDYSETIKFNLDVFPERVITSSPKNSAFLVMTHSHATDFALIEEILRKKNINYVGMIGSKSKRVALTKYLKRKNISETMIDLVSCPIGRQVILPGRKNPEVIAALTISDILVSFGKKDRSLFFDKRE